MHLKYFKEINKKKINSLDLCINYAFSQKKTKYIIVGCENAKQLKEILNVSVDSKIKNYDYYKKLFNIPEAEKINF